MVNNNTDSGSITVDSIMAKIKEEARARRLNSPCQAPHGITPSSQDLNTYNIMAIRATIPAATQNCDAGAKVSSMESFHGINRKLALLFGKIVVYLASFITDKQRHYNREVLRALELLTDGLERAISENHQNTQRLTKEIDSLRNDLKSLKSFHEQDTIFQKQNARLEDLNHRIEEAGKNAELILTRTRDHEVNILDQQRRLGLLLEEARKRLPALFNDGQIENVLKAQDHLPDAMYVAFEDRFRGTREGIKEGLKVYLSYLEKVRAGTEGAPILDVACGRGEWLELLHENKYVAKGIDLNKVMVDQCRERGFDVIEADAIDYLRRQEDNSLGAITSFHLVEHLPLKTLLALLGESLRALRPGGMAIFETPNPENLIVGACNFYYDPTHRKPFPPESLKFILEQSGFERTEIKKLHPNTSFESQCEIVGASASLFDLLIKEQDYSVIGYKSSC